MPPNLTPECNFFNAEGAEFAEETWLLGWSLPAELMCLCEGEKVACQGLAPRHTIIFNAEGAEFAEETWLLGWSLQWVGCGELHEPHRW